MKNIKYSASEGYQDIECEPEWSEGMFGDQWLRAAGFEPDEAEHDRVADEPLGYGPSVTVYSTKNGDPTPAGWIAAVSVTFSETVEYVMVRTRADLLHLRLSLAPLHSFALAQRLEVALMAGMKAFHALHGHDVYEVCDECAPREAAAQRALTEKFRAEEASRGSGKPKLPEA